MANKILFFQHSSRIGGGSWCLLEIIQEMDREVNEVEVVLMEEGQLRNELESMGIKVHLVPEFPLLSIAHPGYRNFFHFSSIKEVVHLFQNHVEMEEVINNFKPDVVYLNSIVQFPVAHIAKKCGVQRTVLHNREHYDLRCFDPRHWIWLHMLNNDIDKVLSISEIGAELAVRGKEFTIARDWVDFTTRGSNFELDIYDKYSLPRDKAMILVTGGLSTAKGSVNTARAFLKMKNKDCICVVLGGTKKVDNSAYRRFRRFIGRLLGKYPVWYLMRKLASKSERIFLLPSVLCVKQFFEAAEVVVCVYNLPHCAKPALEAAVFKKCAIVADNPEGLEYVKDGETGFVVSPGNSDELARTIERALSGSTDMAKLGENAFEYVNDEFSKEKSIARIKNAMTMELN